MDSPDRPRTRPDDVTCSVCREPVPSDRTRLLARRDDLVFVELRCRACASVTRGFVFAPDDRRLPDALRLADSPAISADDVLDMHRLLEAWDGDLHALLADGGRRR